MTSYSKVVSFFICLSALDLSARDWTNHTGKKLEGELVRSDGQNVQLLVAKRIVTYPLAQLSTADQEFVSQTVAAKGYEQGHLASLPVTEVTFPKLKSYVPWMLADSYKDSLPLEEVMGRNSAETFQAYLPKNYDGSTPTGLIVFIHPVTRLSKKHFAVADEKNLILMSANGFSIDQDGRSMDPRKVIRRSLDAASTAFKLFSIDPLRCVSAGSHSNHYMAAGFPGTFFGCITFDYSRCPFPQRERPPASAKKQKFAIAITPAVGVIREQESRFVKSWEDTNLNYRVFDYGLKPQPEEDMFRELTSWIGL